VWLETFATDTWSLQQQNEEGESLTIHLQRERQKR
jgi:hypothetical protein